MDFVFQLDRIKEAPFPIEREIALADLQEILGAEPPTGFVAREAARFSGTLTRVDGHELVFAGGTHLELTTSCRRCLGRAEVRLDVRFTLCLVHRSRVAKKANMPVEDDGAGEIAGTFTPDEADQILYDGTEVDLAPAVREQILLTLPMSALCKDDCRGLCQVCGQDLNERECGCDRRVPDPRWAALRSIKLPR